VGKRKENRIETLNSFEGREVSNDRLGGWNLKGSSQTLSGFVT
jgi:hypothetical protein